MGKPWKCRSIETKKINNLRFFFHLSVSECSGSGILNYEVKMLQRLATPRCLGLTLHCAQCIGVPGPSVLTEHTDSDARVVHRKPVMAVIVNFQIWVHVYDPYRILYPALKIITFWMFIVCVFLYSDSSHT